MQANALCGYQQPTNGAQTNFAAVNSSSVSQVYTSIGEQGQFVWYDRANNYFGVYVQYYNWPWILFLGVCSMVFWSFFCCGASVGLVYAVNTKKAKKKAEAKQSPRKSVLKRERS